MKKRVLEVKNPNVEVKSQSTEDGIYHINYDEILLLDPVKSQELPVVAEAYARNKAQWGDAIPPYFAGISMKSHIFVFEPEPDEDDCLLAHS